MSCASTRPSAAASATRFGAERAKIEMSGEALLRFLRRHHFEELLLPRGAAHGGDQVGFGFVQGALMAAASP